MGDTLLSNCRVQAPGKLLWLRAVCRWEPERARAKPRWETSFSRWQPPAATGDQGISEQWVIKWSYSPDSEEILRTQILVVRSASIRVSEDWETCSGYSGTGGRWDAVLGEARRGWGRGGWGGARSAPSLQTSWPSTRSPVTWDSWTERTCTFSFRWVRFPSFYN